MVTTKRLIKIIAATTAPSQGKADLLVYLNNNKSPSDEVKITPAAPSERIKYETKLCSSSPELLRRSIATAIIQMRARELKTLAIDCREENQDSINAIVESLALCDYQFTKYSQKLKNKQKDEAIQEAVIITDTKQLQATRKTIKQALATDNGVRLTRDLVNEPASRIAPSDLVSHAKDIAKQKDIKLRVLNKAAAKRDKWNAFLAVAQGSNKEPYVIHLTYKPKKAKKKIVLVGKGITFDSGGLSIKPSASMEDMKIDMGGAATVLGLFSILKDRKPNTEIHGIIATCENMISGNAYRPGDILESRSGKTIEVLNTDAEGRLTLADALDYATELKPDAIIDLATLTGACMVALGETYAGLWSNNNELNKQLRDSSKKTGESIEDLPLPQEYKQFIESPVADLRNIGSNNYGGAITAALFLQEFVGDTPWAHLDIAGPTYMKKPILPYHTSGATGFGVRLLADMLS